MEIPTEPIGSVPCPRGLVDALCRHGATEEAQLEALHDDAGTAMVEIELRARR